MPHMLRPTDRDWWYLKYSIQKEWLIELTFLAFPPFFLTVCGSFSFAVEGGSLFKLYDVVWLVHLPSSYFLGEGTLLIGWTWGLGADWGNLDRALFGANGTNDCWYFSVILVWRSCVITVLRTGLLVQAVSYQCCNVFYFGWSRCRNFKTLISNYACPGAERGLTNNLG